MPIRWKASEVYTLVVLLAAQRRRLDTESETKRYVW